MNIARAHVLLCFSAALLVACSNDPAAEGAESSEHNFSSTPIDTTHYAGKYSRAANDYRGDRVDFVDLTLHEDGKYEALVTRRIGTCSAEVCAEAGTWTAYYKSDGRYLELDPQNQSDRRYNARMEYDGGPIYMTRNGLEQKLYRDACSTNPCTSTRPRCVDPEPGDEKTSFCVSSGAP